MHKTPGGHMTRGGIRHGEAGYAEGFLIFFVVIHMVFFLQEGSFTS
jgi:hypothetical protein